MAFFVGQLVECVDDRPGQITGLRELRRGRVYTVTFFSVDPFPRVAVDGSLHSWLPSRFRPLTDTRIAVFRKLLAPSPSKQTEDA